MSIWNSYISLSNSLDEIYDSQWLVMKIGHQDINSNIGHHDSMRQVVFSS